MRKTIGRSLAALLIASALFPVDFSGKAQAQVTTHQTEKATIRVERIATGLEHPWAMTMLPDGKILVTERPGRLLLVDPANGGRKTEVPGLPSIWASGQGGLLDIAADPDFAENRRVFFTFSDPAPGRGAGTAIASATFEASPSPRLTNVKILFSMANKTSGGRHFGSRIVFAPDGTVFITTGDRGDRPRAQDPFDAAGKIIRINKDGSIPADNPFADGKQALPQVWSIGHRNPQGATLNNDTGELWTLSHGARGGDEINIPEKGKNYGWPNVSFGVHYSGGKIGEGTSGPGYEQPIFYWDPSIAPSGFDFYDGDLIPQWKGNLFAGALKDQLLSRLEVDGDKITHEEQILEGNYGRIRDVKSFPDGALWLLTDDSEGELLRLTGG